MENEVVELLVTNVNEVILWKQVTLLIRAVVGEGCKGVEGVPVPALTRIA